MVGTVAVQDDPLIDQHMPLQYAPPGSTIAYLPEEANGLATAMEMYEDHLDIAAASATYGVRPTTLDEYIDRTFVRR